MKTTVRTILLFIGYCILIGLLFICYAAKDEGTLGNNLLLNFSADYLYFFAMPAFLFATVLEKTGLNNVQVVAIAIVLCASCYLYLTLWIYNIIKKRRGRQLGT